MKIAVIGGKGRWGSCFVIVLRKNGHEVSIIDTCHSPDKHSCKDADVVIMATRGEHFIGACEMWLENISETMIVLNATKAIFAENGRMLLPHRILKRYTQRYATFACGGFPEDIGRGFPVDATLFSGFTEIPVLTIRDLFDNTPIKIGLYSEDITGGEIGSALKNIAAIASGMCHELGYPEMTRSMLMNKIGREIIQIATKHGADPGTFSLGRTCFAADYMGTGFSHISHNFRAGMALARKLQPKIKLMLLSLSCRRRVQREDFFLSHTHRNRSVLWFRCPVFLDYS